MHDWEDGGDNGGDGDIPSQNIEPYPIIIGPYDEDETTISHSSGPFEGEGFSFAEELEFYGDFFSAVTDVEDAFVFASNWGRPVYKRVKGVIPGATWIEGGIGFFTQLAKDIPDPNVNGFLTVTFRAVITGFEDMGTDVVSTFVGTTITGPPLATVGGAITSETGLGSVFGYTIGGATGVFGGSYVTTRAMDEWFWEDYFNPRVFPELFPEQ
jgi:hypothetical protein